MALKRIAAALILLLLILPITGCWDRREMNELGIALAMGIDRVGKNYIVTAQIVKPGQVAAAKGSGSLDAPVVMYKAEGTTIFEAIRKMTTTSPRKIYAAHLRVLLLGEAMARQGIGNALDLLSRDYELRTDFYLLVARGATAEKALNIVSPLERIPANMLFRSIETSEKAWAPVVSITLDDFVNDIVSNGKNPIISGIRIVDGDGDGSSTNILKEIRPRAMLESDGIGVFRNDRLIGWMSEEESKGYNYITNNVKSTVGHISCPGGGHVALEVVLANSKMSGKMVGGRPRLAVDLRVEGSVGEVECRIDLTKISTIQELERRAKETLTRILRSSLNAGQKKFKSDYFGFGNAIHRSNPQAWKQVQKDWDEHFEDAVIDLHVQVKIKRTGTITNSFMEQEE
ncbi:Ger(x)C family spore germination protein [Paenibacillus sp. OV219]|uniref:Ger(x)C family spore germination protein n=1 Tax=Paenibacillus sp. OV219 TaxID=1884377 RepID=UPI0008C66B9B|nr:Ger(x)C family spore germination protein [Paenibacillus sp. OV219]SEO01360.1 spore germination protein KC [Paenibacillus sp. OV219]